MPYFDVQSASLLTRMNTCSTTQVGAGGLFPSAVSRKFAHARSQISKSSLILSISTSAARGHRIEYITTAYRFRVQRTIVAARKRQSEGVLSAYYGSYCNMQSSMIVFKCEWRQSLLQQYRPSDIRRIHNRTTSHWSFHDADCRERARQGTVLS